MTTTGSSDSMAKALFGRSLRAQVALAVLDEPAGVFVSGLQLRLGQPMSAVSAELDRLARAGLLRRAEASSADRRVYFFKIESPFWKVFESFAEAKELIAGTSTDSAEVAT